MDHTVTKVMLQNNWGKFLTNSLFVLSIIFLSLPARAEDNITVDISVLDEITTKLLIPESRTAPLILRPPSTKRPRLHKKNTIKLQPPPSMIKRAIPATDNKIAAAQKKTQSTKPDSALKNPQPIEGKTVMGAQARQVLGYAVSEPLKPTAITPKVTTTIATDITSGDVSKTRQTEHENSGDKKGVPPTEDVKTAALLESKTVLAQANEFTIPYGVGKADVPEKANNSLRILAARMMKDVNLRVEFIAFASDAEGSVSRSRRLSLERAVNARKVILDAGVDSSRVNLRALGEQDDDREPDRINVIVTTR